MSRPHLHELAVSTGFCQRESKLRPEVFFDLLLYTVAEDNHKSLSQMVSLLQSDFHVEITKQPLDERFNQKCELFVKAVLTEVLEEKFAEMYSGEFLPAFRCILIKDSTRFMTPDTMQEGYRGYGGNSKKPMKSGISVQYEYDLKNGRITD